ncbi:MAG TPA: hypothetical protein DD649_15885 [Providencia sp.]|nr:IS3 family transposase [Providencia sp.]HBO24347.1 hypothetical protein [Providencia sp.]
MAIRLTKKHDNPSSDNKHRYAPNINHQSAVYEIENYIQFYNYSRRHSMIGYLTPHQKYHELKMPLRSSSVFIDHYKYTYIK